MFSQENPGGKVLCSLMRTRGSKVLCSLPGEPGVVRCCVLSQEDPGW